MFESLLKNVSAGAVRHAATAFGGYLVANGLADMSQEQSIIGCAVFGVGLAFSVWDKYQAKKKRAAA